MATARDDPRWSNFSPSEITMNALRDAQRHPKDWTDSLNRGWGGVKSKKSEKARAMAPVLQKMLLKDGKGNLPDGCIDFQLGMKESQEIQKECRVLETRRRLEERASKKLKEQKKDLIQILDSCSTNVLKIDEFRKQYNKNMLQSTSSRARLMQTVEWLDEIMTVQAQYLMSKYIGIEIPSVDPRMDSVFSPEMPSLNTAANISYAARRAGISTRGSFLTVSDYIKQYTKEKDQLGINEYPLIGTYCDGGGLKTREMHKSIKAPRKYGNPHHCLWNKVKTAALIPFLPDSIRKLICVAEIDTDGNSTTWWKRFKKFWYHQDSLPMQERDHETAINFMDEWNRLDINYIFNMENALSDSPGKMPWRDPDQEMEFEGDDMIDLFDNAYGNVVIEELSMAEMDKMTKQVTAQLKSRCEQQGIGCLDNPSKTFVREFLGMSKLSHENNLSLVPSFNNLPPLPILMAEAVPVNHRVLLEDSSQKKSRSEEPDQHQQQQSINPDISISSSNSSSSGNEDDKELLQSSPHPDTVMNQSTSLPPRESVRLTQTHLVLNDNGSLNTFLTERLELPNSSDKESSSEETLPSSPTEQEQEEQETLKKDSLEVSLETLISKNIIEPGDAAAVRMFLKHAEIMLKLKIEKGAELSYKRLRWALSRCWALINFLCSVTNSIYQNSKQEAKGTEIITRYEAVRTVLNRHFSSPDVRAILSSAGTGKEDEVIYGNTIHEASWPADFPLMNLKQAKNLGPCSSSMTFGSSNISETRSAAAIEVEAPWGYTVGGWVCIRCMQKLKQRWGDCRCRCFRGHKRRQCMGPMSHCYGFHPNRLMEYLALGLQTRYNDGRGPGDAYFNRTWAGRQRWRRWRMCIKDIVLNGDSWFGVVPKNQQRLGFTGLSTNLKELTRDWLERVDWSHYSLWNKKRRRYNLFAMNVARLDMLVRCGSWFVMATEQKKPEAPPTKKKKRAANHKKAVWSSISGRCAMCGQDLIVNKNNTSRGLCVGCRSWKAVTNVETQLIGNLPEYRFFNAKASSISDMDQDCVRRFFAADNQFIQARPTLCPDSAALGIAVAAFSSDGILTHVKNRMRNLLYPDQEGLNEEEEEDDIPLGHWHDGIYYPHQPEKPDSNAALESKLYTNTNSKALPPQEEQEGMLRGVWEEVRIEICCWSEASFKDLLKESSWDSESIALAREWRRVWHNVIKCFQNKNDIQEFRKIMMDAFSSSSSSSSSPNIQEASMLSLLPTNLIPKNLTIFGTIKPMSKMSQCKEMIYMKRQDQIYASSKSCLSRLMRWWPRPVVNMVNRWMRWKDDLTLFQKVRRNFAKKTIVPKKKKIKFKADTPPLPPMKQIKKPLASVIRAPPVSSVITVTKTEIPRLSFSARWCLNLPEKQKKISRKRKRPVKTN